MNPLRRQRGEKKPIPEDLKDEKYYERRKRNNQAAKKSRDARKLREDQVALRASILEHENAILRAQVLTLREESTSLRRLLLQKKAIEIVSGDALRFGDHEIL
ncbi:hepatic leukemia factor-like [Harmonia axyridis]|uniref:hepatic leukemia factor-like n=1 Tax=Harmonia axyridis TaxID=115357 RepID=UPI001E276B09|nr:hepatic leukemia factor-like [Harmonia axyridis]